MAFIRQRGKNSWQIIVSCGYDINGKKLAESMTVKRPRGLTDKQWEKELDRIAFEFETKVRTGQYLDGSKMTFAGLCDVWMDKYAKKSLEPKTYLRYKDMLESRIIPALGHIKLDKLQPTHLLDFYANLNEPGIRMDSKFVCLPAFAETFYNNSITIRRLKEISKISDKTISRALKGERVTCKTADALSKAMSEILNHSTKDSRSTYFVLDDDPKPLDQNTILHHHRLISSILQDAFEWQIISTNPAKRTKSPKSKKSKQTFYSRDQMKEFIDALSTEPIKYRTMTILDAFTGLRIGEFMGLDWNDVDLENGTITVNKVSQYLRDRGTFIKDKPKNDSSIRTIKISPFVVSLLKQYKVWWNEQKLSCGDFWQDNNFLFVTWDGRLLYTYTLTNWLPEFLERHNLPKITPHGIRHTFASLLAKKIPLPELSRLLGHARISTTDIYIHNLLGETNEEAGDLLEEMLLEENLYKKKDKLS